MSFLVGSTPLVGNAAGQVPTNSLLGSLAYQNTIFNSNIAANAAIVATKLSFTQSGANAAGLSNTRTVDSKLKDVISIRDFGALPSASANVNYLAISAAIDATPTHGSVYIPGGTYNVDSPIIIQKVISVMGDGPGQSGINATHSNNIIIFRPTTAGVTTATLGGGGRGASIQNLRISRSGIASNTCLWMNQVSYFTARNVHITGGNYCFRWTGGLFNSMIGCGAWIYPSSPVNKLPTSALILFDESEELSGETPGTYQPCYTVNVTDFHGVAGNVDSAIHFNCIDGAQITNCYFSYCRDSIISISSKREASPMAGINITNSYLDCVGFPYGAIVDDNGPRAIRVYHNHPSAAGVVAMNLSNCKMANNRKYGGHQELILFEKYGYAVSFNNCYIANLGTPWAIKINDTRFADAGSYTISQNEFSNLNRAVYIGNGAQTAFNSAFSQAGFVVLVNGIQQIQGIHYTLSGTEPNTVVNFFSAPAGAPSNATIEFTSTNGGAILANNAKQLALVGNIFQGIPYSNSLIKIEGISTHVTSMGNVFDGPQANLILNSTGATISNRLNLNRSADLATLPLPKTVSNQNSYTIDPGDYYIRFNARASGTGNTTVTFPSASVFSGRILKLSTVTANGVNSSTTNIVPHNSLTPGTAVLPTSSSGSWATLQSDGSNWIISQRG